MTTLSRSLFTLVTRARLDLLLAAIRKAGLLLVSPDRVTFTPLRLVPAPGLMVIRTIGLGKATELRATGLPTEYRALLAAMPPRFMKAQTPLVLVWLTGPLPLVRTRKTPLTCLPPLWAELSMELFGMMELEQMCMNMSPLQNGRAETPKIRVENGLAPIGRWLTLMDLLLGPQFPTVGMLLGDGRQLMMLLSTGRMFPLPKVEL